jgi:hypothetical protein
LGGGGGGGGWPGQKVLSKPSADSFAVGRRQKQGLSRFFSLSCEFFCLAFVCHLICPMNLNTFGVTKVSHIYVIPSFTYVYVFIILHF